MKTIILTAALCSICAGYASANEHRIDVGRYTILYDDVTREMNIRCDGAELFNKVCAEATYNVMGSDEDVTISSKSVAATLSEESISDCFGSGRSYVFSYTDGTATMRQRFNFYTGREDYFFCQNSVESTDGSTILQSRRLVPLTATDTYSSPVQKASSPAVRMVWVPFDNDGFGRFHNYSFINMTEDDSYSHEVGAAFSPTERSGIVAGSVDHDKWKSAVQIYGRYNTRLYKFQLISGYTSEKTRDKLPHGKVKGQIVASARYMVGKFDDWREGMNTFGDCCNAVVPKARWDAGTPVGWSTYGVMQERVNEQGVIDVSSYIYDNFREAGFYDSTGTLSISFDACANDNISDTRCKRLITREFTPRDMVLGMYAGHLCVWPWALDSKVDGTGIGANPAYTYRQAALKVNGEPYQMPSNGSMAIDPTHPAVKLNLEKFMRKWAAWGVKYVKVDFINSGIIEGDSWYDPEITTGVMAYNYGMKMMKDIADEYGIYIVEAMSPIFPYQYAHGRRTCCDSFASIGESEYVMNAISYGWWTDRLYTVNDPDQLVLLSRNGKKAETEGENRARATSGVATGAYIWGDNFSDNCVHTSDEEAAKQGVSIGDPVGWPTEAKERAAAILGNKEINEYVRTHTGSMMPVYTDDPTTSLNGLNFQAEHVFMRRDESRCFVAAFSYSKTSAYTKQVKWSDLGLLGSDVRSVRELWTGSDVTFSQEGFTVRVPKADACVYCIELNTSGIGSLPADPENATSVTVTCSDGRVHVKAQSEIASVRIFSVDGAEIATRTDVRSMEAVVPVNSDNILLVKTLLTDGTSFVSKTIAR